MYLKNQFLIEASQDEVWSVFMDAEKLGKCVPGCKEIMMISPTKYDAVMEVKIQFMTITFQASGELKDAKEKEQITVEMTGKPVALVGLFRNKLIVNLTETENGETLVDYEMDLQLTGRLASLGDILMRGTITKSANEFAENVQKLFQHSN
ncbi:carbon monoxide dehydrogenase subunit G [Bacillus mesophilus]|uniref:Carbon monoxide dehydrogenase subunit G n=1 Tax=Bacillus mesophilus TaxID=1808955 RepID=A0A6M0QAN9_9BACI|nr:SRPBCC domain-containing protein [Bacillus mesophilus]MBM7662871.1 carbon monoxide dehydrogenase subunit G [Bacillus mesophilus]NEY73461.1 hypothetical protein [Bacillus mesophilus]